MRRLLSFILFLTLWPGPIAAQQQQAYDVRFRGVTVAQITVALRSTPADYAIAAQVRASRLAGLFATIRFDMAAEGRFSPHGPSPVRFREDNNTGRRQSSVEMRWSGGVPVVVSQSPAPGPEAVPPAAAAGAIDPLSALMMILRDQGTAAPCSQTLTVYDGARRSRLGVGAARLSGDHARCSGEYQRLDGYHAEELANRTHFPFTLHYARVDGDWRLTEVDASSLYGPIRILRRD
jgi:hypothetical protein